MWRVFFISSLFFGFLQTQAQFNPVKQAQAKFAKGKWREGRTLLDKAIKKDSLQVQAHFVYSQLYLNKRYSNFHLDSAHWYATRAKTLWRALTYREQDKLRKFPLDSGILSRLYTTIDSLAFAQTKDFGTESAYLHFLQVYTDSKQRALAIELRDEAAFMDALKSNTHIAFYDFLKKYSTGHRSDEARQRYEKLLYEFSTRTNSLQQFKQFVIEHPNSPYVQDALVKIFEIETLGGEADAFERFIDQYPNTVQAGYARLLLIHLREELLVKPDNDSLSQIYPTKEWLPIHQEHGWGFIDQQGKVMLSGLPELHETNFCQSLQTDFILTTTGIFSRNGKLIHPGDFASARDLGAGFLLLRSADGGQVLHKTKWPIHIKDVTDAQVVLKRFLAIKHAEQWALYSLSGKALTDFVFQSIESYNNFTLFKRAGKTSLVPNNQIILFTQAKYQPIVADEIKPIGDRFWLRNGALEQVIDEQSNVILPFARHHISYGALGLMVTQNDQTILPDWQPLNQTPAKSIIIAEPWAIIEGVGQKPELHHIPTKKVVEVADSIWFNQSLTLTKRGDSIRLRLPDQQSLNITSDENISIHQSKDSTPFILIKHKNGNRVINAKTLKEIFRSEYQLDPILHNVFIFELKGKKGLLDGKGKIILPAVYDAILFNQGTFSLLQKNLFGAFHATTKKTIKPAFESNLRAIGKNSFIARKKSKWVFLSSEGKELSKFSFDDILPLSDSIALVKLANGQALFDITSQKILLDSLNGAHQISQEDHDDIYIIDARSGYGLIDRLGKIVIEPTLEELVTIETRKATILMGLSIVNPQNRLIQYFTASGKIIYSFIAPKELAYSLLCD